MSINRLPVLVPTPKKVFLRRVLLHYIFLKKNASESNRILERFYGDQALAERTCQKWYKRFKSSNFTLEDDARKNFEDEELVALLIIDSSQTQKELAKTFGVSQQAICARLKAKGVNQKVRKCVPTCSRKKGVNVKIVDLSHFNDEHFQFRQIRFKLAQNLGFEMSYKNK